MILQQKMNSSEKDKNFIGKYTLYSETGIVKEVEIQYGISQFGVKNDSFFAIKELS